MLIKHPKCKWCQSPKCFRCRHCQEFTCADCVFTTPDGCHHEAPIHSLSWENALAAHGIENPVND